tara:strand:+ start:6364 stop:7227 length:864 start_codon:yes stop_codon:yes gene_type:complete
LQIINNKKLSHWPQNWGEKTSIMGILNVTPDSFSDGGDFFSIDKSIKRTEEYISQGVDIIDIGAQSTRPGAIEIGSSEEIKRIVPILKEIRTNFPKQLISVDTFNSEVAYEALSLGANWINDVTGGRRDPRILDVASDFNCPFVITHSRGNSQTMNSLSSYEDLTNNIISSLKDLTEKALNKKIRKNNILWDPGLGFSKNTKQNIDILKNIYKFKEQGFPLLIGASRKRFIGEILNINKPKDRDIGSLAISCFCSFSDIDIVRVHNVELNSQILKVSDSIYRNNFIL